MVPFHSLQCQIADDCCYCCLLLREGGLSSLPEAPFLQRLPSSTVEFFSRTAISEYNVPASDVFLPNVKCKITHEKHL